MLGLMNMYISWPILIVIIIAGIGVGVLLGLLIKNRPYSAKSDSGYKSSGVISSGIGAIGGSITTDYEYEHNSSHEEMKKKMQELESDNSKLKNETLVLKEKVDELKEKLKYTEAKLKQIAKELQKEDHPIYNRIIQVVRVLGSKVFAANQNNNLQQATVTNYTLNNINNYNGANANNVQAPNNNPNNNINNNNNANNNTSVSNNSIVSPTSSNAQVQNNQNTSTTINNNQCDDVNEENDVDDRQQLIEEAISSGYVEQENGWCDTDGNKVANTTDEMLEYLRNLKLQQSRLK